MKLRLSLGYLLLGGALVFVFFVIQSPIVLAAHCTLTPGNSEDCIVSFSHSSIDSRAPILYEDPNEGDNSKLAVCEYQVVASGDPPIAGAWISAGDCSGQSNAVLHPLVSFDLWISASGEYDIWKRSKDNAGNSSIEKSILTFLANVDIVDIDAPAVSVLGAPADWQSIDATASVSCSDDGSGCDISSYKLKSYASAGSCSTSYVDYNLSNPQTVTEHQWICATGKDQAGNIGFSPSRVEFKVDTILPDITEFTVVPPDTAIPPALSWVNIDNPDVKIEWTVGDLGGSFLQKVRVFRIEDGGTIWEQIAGSPFAAPLNSVSWENFVMHTPTTNGTYFYGIHVVDNAENFVTESNTGFAPISVRVDIIKPPKPTCTPSDIPGYIDSVTVTCVNGNLENEEFPSDVVIRYTTDGSDPVLASTIYISPLLFTSSTLLKIAAWDIAENRSDIKIYSYQVGSLPDTFITSNPLDPSTSMLATFAFYGSENPTSFQCELNGGGFSTCTSPKGYSGLSEGFHTFQVKAINAIGEDPSPASYSWTINLNDPPVISSVSDSPDPISVSSDITFSVNWSDPDGDAVKLFICESNNGVTGGTCQGGSSNTWCKDLSVGTSSPATCSYNTKTQDSGVNNYYAYICDGDDECAVSSLGTFLVDISIPNISAFEVTPVPPTWISIASPDVTISWTVGDSGGAFIKEVQIWKSPDEGGSWELASIVSAPPAVNSWEDLTTDNPSSGVYLYGIHAVDNAGNEITEKEAGFSPILVWVDVTEPNAGFREPPKAGTWFKDDFDVTFDDSDLGGSGLVSMCEYQFFGSNPDGDDEPSGILTRQCDLDTKTITVGTGDVCQFEGRNQCRVETRSFDNAGNTSGWSVRTFGVDFTRPIIDNLQPSTVHVGAVTTVTGDLVDPIGHIDGCTLYTTLIGTEDWIIDSTTTDPIPCENGAECTVSGDHTFNEIGEYQVQFSCIDQAGNTGWGVSTAQAETLSVVGSVVPSVGTPETQFDLTSTVSGTMTGLINYKFDCTSDGTWELEVSEETASSYTAEDVCLYASEGSYTATVLVERGIGTAVDTIPIEVLSNASPSAKNLQDNNSIAEYCFASTLPIILSWKFDDPNLPADSQSAYQVQIDTNAGFSSPDIDSGKVSSSSESYAPAGLSYDTKYYWRVKVWDELDIPSAWAVGSSFTTPAHAYPITDFSWSPLFPSADEEVQFTDETFFASGSTGQSWAWDFGDTSSSTEQNPIHMYSEISSRTVELIATDDVGSCTSSQVIQVSIPLPEWSEISPF